MEDELREYIVNEIPLKLYDIKGSNTTGFVVYELFQNSYGLNELPDDQTLILDCGAHVGTISIYLAKKYPKAKIIALEPFPMNYTNLCKNIKENNCDNIIAINIGLSGDGQKIGLTAEIHNTGSANQQFECDKNIETIKLDDLFKVAIPEDKVVSFLKMDIERAEYATLRNFTQWHRIKDLGIELHDDPECIKPKEGWKEKIFEFEAWLRTKPILGKMWAPAHHLYDL